MKITKFVHSCLLVETEDRTALFDPGAFSVEALPVDSLTRLDDIFITHVHFDHCDVDLLKRLIAKFPAVRITSTAEVAQMLAGEGVKAATTPPAGVSLFASPHEGFAPLMPQPPQATGFHYLDSLSHPGDSHSFTETKAILAIPMQAPWGSTMRAAQLLTELKPQHVLPIHDWHWRDEFRATMYETFAQLVAGQGGTFHKLQTGQPIEVNV